MYYIVFVTLTMVITWIRVDIVSFLRHFNRIIHYVVLTESFIHHSIIWHPKLAEKSNIHNSLSFSFHLVKSAQLITVYIHLCNDESSIFFETESDIFCDFFLEIQTCCLLHVTQFITKKIEESFFYI